MVNAMFRDFGSLHSDRPHSRSENRLARSARPRPKSRNIFTLAMALLLSSATCADSLTRFDFEDGTLQGWNVVSGQAGRLPTGPETSRADQTFSQQGKYFIGLYENPALDTATIVIESPRFTVSSSMISLLVGGGYHRDKCYVSLHTSDGSEIARETGTDSESMSRRVWDVSVLRGKDVFIRIVDSETGQWGHINVDDIHEMTDTEANAWQAEHARENERYDTWLRTVSEPSKRMVRSGKQLAAVAMPIGGIGGGHVSICGDGAVRQWNIFNNCVEAFVIPDSFFAIWAKPLGGNAVAKLLQKTPAGDLPTVEDVAFLGEYPIAELDFRDGKLPVEVKLKAFSPHIPLNARDSAIPTAVFEFTIRNRTAQPVQVSLLSTLQNAVGMSASRPIKGVWSKYYGGNVNVSLDNPRLHGVLLTNPNLKPDARTPGTMALATFSRNAKTLLQWNNPGILWQVFSRTGSLPQDTGSGPSPDGQTWNSAVAVPAELGPTESIKITYIWTWHFPKRFVLWDNRARDADIGTMYSNWFADAREVADYVASNYTRLAGDTEKFRQTFYKTSLPYWMLDRISAQSSTLVTSVCMWLKDGAFCGFEGGPMCCPMNCTHVWNYEQQMAYLFPELDRNMRHTDFAIQQVDEGWIRHRTRLPLHETRENMPFCDGHLGTILKAYREHRQSPDQAFLDKYWPNIKLAMQAVMDRWDRNGDGVIVGSQWNTYDATMYGPNTFIGTLYLGALRACEEMAKIKGEPEFAVKLRQRFEIGSKRHDSALWTGEYYRQIEAEPTASEVGENKWLLEDWPRPDSERPDTNRPYGKGCHIDQFLGQWWANQLDLGYLLPADRVRTGLDSIVKFNWIKDFSKVTQSPRAFAGEGEPGMYTCTWPYGGKPKYETMYSFEVWTGLEYELAGLLIQEGRIADAYRIVKAVSDRYDGVERRPIRRNPWAEVECGNHYVRAMSSWGMLLAAQGYIYSGPDKHIGFDPKVTPDNHASFFTASEGWGLFTQKRTASSQVNELSVEYGKLEIKELTLRLPEEAGDRAQVTVDKRFGDFATKRSGSQVTLCFDEPFTVKAGEKLAISFRW